MQDVPRHRAPDLRVSNVIPIDPNRVPSPADTPQYTADELLRELRERGGRIFRMREVFVFTLTNDQDVARWLLELGARGYRPYGAEVALQHLPTGAFLRAKGAQAEWDLYIHTIPVRGEETIWEAAARWAKTVEPTEFA